MNHDTLARFCDRHNWHGTPEHLIAHLCGELLREASSAAPVDVHVLASYRGARVEEVEQPHAGVLIWDGERLLIRVRTSDSEERRRFTVCHEVCHTFFPGFREMPRTRADFDVERFDPRDPEEYLCDVGAAELLLPRDEVSALLRHDFTLDEVIALAAHFRASIEATGLRCVALSAEPVALVVLERMWDPLVGAASPSGNLCVRRAASTGLPKILPGTPLPHDVPLARVLERKRIMYQGEAGLLPGIFAVSARSMPYERAGRPVERAVALLRPKRPHPL